MRRLLASLCLAAATAAVAAQSQAQAQSQPGPEQVPVPSLDSPGGVAVHLPGHWFRAPGVGPAPAVLALHGCGGLYDGRGRLAERYVELAARLNALGVHMLATDSLQPRGEKELCTQRTGQRKVTQLQRRRDALGALQWLAAQPGVDASRLGLLGWSNGGSTVLAASNQRHPEVAAARVRPSLVVAFYPGCESELQRGYLGVAPLLLLLGDADDWTPAAPCATFAARLKNNEQPVNITLYPGAFHDFDNPTGKFRVRSEVPNGVNAGKGVTVGPDPKAREDAMARIDALLVKRGLTMVKRSPAQP